MPASIEVMPWPPTSRAARRAGNEIAAVGRPAAIGDEVVAQDGSLGFVEQVIRFETRVAAYLVVAVGRGLGRRYPVVPCSLVTAVDRASRRVHLHGRRESLRRLSETPPLVV